MRKTDVDRYNDGSGHPPHCVFDVTWRGQDEDPDVKLQLVGAEPPQDYCHIQLPGIGTCVICHNNFFSTELSAASTATTFSAPLTGL